MKRPTLGMLQRFRRDVGMIPESDQGVLATVARCLIAEIDALTVTLRHVQADADQAIYIAEQERDEARARLARLEAVVATLPGLIRDWGIELADMSAETAAFHSAWVALEQDGAP